MHAFIVARTLNSEKKNIAKNVAIKIGIKI